MSCSFSFDWIDKNIHPEWSPWLQESQSKDKAYCNVCKKTISLSNMGIQAIKSHSIGAKHKKNIAAQQKSVPIGFFFKKASAPNSDAKASSEKENKNLVPNENIVNQEKEGPSKRVTLDDFNFGSNLLESEVTWCIGSVASHLSNRQAESCQKLFKKMFNDSKLAQKFSVHKDKQGYLATHGLLPYFQDQISKDLTESSFFSVSYDESLNKISQKTQMDIHVRYVEPSTGLIATRYLTSEFLESSKAVDLLRHLHQGLGNVKMDRLLSVSMDGPNVNWSMLNELKLELETSPDSPELIEFGSCALHVVHGALKTGHASVSWNVIEFLRSIFYLFNDFPSRKAAYTRITGTSKFPEKFCTTRWVENAKACTTALGILPHIRKYIEAVGKLPTSKVFAKVKLMLEDPFLEAKLGFFQGLAHKLERFLRMFQDGRPLVPFLYDELFHLVSSILKLICKPNVYAGIKTASDCFKVDLNNSNDLISPENLELFNSSKEGIRKNRAKCGVSDILKFKTDCLVFLKTAASKLMSRCPLKYSITKGLSCISPEVILRKSNSRLDLCVEKLISLRRITGLEADEIKEDFEKMGLDREVIEMLKNFKVNEDSLDKLFLKIFQQINACNSFKKFVHIILTLFHGNASVERGFSVNKNCLSDNLQEQSLIARRIVCQEAELSGGAENCQVSKSLLLSCKNAASLYKETLKKKKAEEKNLLESEVNKRKAKSEIIELEAKKRKIMKEAELEQLAVSERIEELKKVV